MGPQQCRRGEGKERSHHPLLCSFPKPLVAVRAHHGQNWQHQRLSYSQTKIKANSVPLTPRRTEIIVSHHQPPRGSSCSPPDSPAGPPALRWELQRGCWRKGNLSPTPGDNLSPFPSRNPTDMQTVRCSLSFSKSISSLKSTHSAFREGEEDGGLPTALWQGRLYFPSAPAALRQAIN